MRSKKKNYYTIPKNKRNWQWDRSAEIKNRLYPRARYMINHGYDYKIKKIKGRYHLFLKKW